MKIKLVLIGSAHTGKTSIANRYVNGSFSPHTLATTQPAFFQKNISLKGKEISLDIWDTAGQERYHSLSPLFYRDSNAGIVVFDITDLDSFQKVNKWICDLKQSRGDNVFIILAGNKCDLKDKRVVDKVEAQKLALKYNAPYFETSALSNENIDSMFNAICTNVLSSLTASHTESTKSIKSTIQFDDEENTNQKNGCC